METTMPVVEVKSRSKWIVLAISGAVALMLVYVFWFARSPGRARRLDRPVAVANDGLPRTPAQLNDWYEEPPAGQNAATFFSQGFTAMQRPKGSQANVPLLGRGQLPPLGAPLPASVKSAVSGFLDSNREALQFFDQGASRDQSRYPVDLSQGFNTVLPHLREFKSAMQLLELAAISHADARDGELAAHDILMALALLRSLEVEPALLSQSMRAANVSLAISALEQAINRTRLSQESLRLLGQTLQKMEHTEANGEGFNRAMVAERAAWLSLLGSPQDLRAALDVPGVDLPAEAHSLILARLEKPAQLQPERSFIEMTFQQLLAARQAPFPERLKTADLIRQRASEAADEKLPISVFLLTGLARPPAKEAACLAQLRLALAAVALEQFRAAHANRYPDALSELSPDFLPAAPADPFDGQSLRYRKESAGYVLSSIGPDLNDDSGARLTRKDGAIVFAVVKLTSNLEGRPKS